MSRKKSIKDLRSRITHENTSLGGGTDGSISSAAYSRGGANPMGGYGNAPGVPSLLSGMPRSTSGNDMGGLLQPGFAGEARGAAGGGAPNLGAGPSFVSLSPSDSVSNYEGRMGGQPAFGAMYDGPSGGSTASFAQTQSNLPPPASPDVAQPMRPARSVRRPQGASPGRPATRERAAPIPGAAAPAAGRNLLAATRAGGGNDRHATSARLMAQVNENGGRATPASEGEEEDIYGGMDAEPTPASPPGSSTSPMLGSLSRQAEPAALGSVLSALSAAARKQGAQRILKGTTAEEESKRRKTERKVEEARRRESKPLESYVDRRDERAFRGINAVLRKVKAEWSFVADDDFNPVSLALSLLDDSSLGSSRREFDVMKDHIEQSLQGTVDDHYESFATAITLHNSVLQSLGAAQTSVSGARRRLRDSREALGQKRADLVQLWQRSQTVKDSLRLLDVVEHLKGVPDRLESLMSEKRFLQAVNLLTRSIKTAEKADIVDVGATADLRVYLKAQEVGMLEILIEELHNHLYLKSFFCDARWKSYAPGQDALPAVDFGREYDQPTVDGVPDAEGGSPSIPQAAKRPPKLTRYLNSLSARPSFDPNLATDMPDVGLPHSITTSALTGEVSAGIKDFPHSKSADANLSLLGGPAAGAASSKGQGGASDSAAADFDQNPEADSFLYIEMLLESLARLGKLSLALDIIQQRLPVELHQLVDATIDEVDQRNEAHRAPHAGATTLQPESLLLASSSALARSFAESTRSSFRSSYSAALVSPDGRPNSTVLRLAESETTAVARDSEMMRDLFWTLFSKLDAVLQGHRVVQEVASKIFSRSDNADAGMGRKVSPPSLISIWRPIQNEVRTLLHDHLTDDSQSASARRNAVVSVNDVLRQGTSGRNRTKKLFKLADPSQRPSAGTALARGSMGPLRRHEETLTAALRASVPGLVSALDASGTSISAQHAQHQQQQVIVSASRTVEHHAGAGYRLLVKPDAFNVSVLFQPALAFVERAQVVIPVGASGEMGKGFSAFLEEFVQDVFLPQLEDKVQSLFQSAVGGPDAFQDDPGSRSLSKRPVVKSAANVVVLIDSLYSMLRTTPFHRESYSHLIIQVIVQYYQKCHERFRDLVTAQVPLDQDAPSPTAAYMLSATWAQRPEISSCLAEAMAPECTPGRKRELHAQENNLELGFAARSGVEAGKPATGSVKASDMITSRKRLMALGNLQHSLRWFLAHISRLRATDQAISVAPAPTARLSVIHTLAPRKPKEEETEDRSLPLPLGKEMAVRFAALPRTYGHLANTILITLRLELRARTIHHLDLAITEGNYVVEEAVLEPDPHVVDLNAELASLDDTFADSVSPEQHMFLFSGIVSLMDTMLCAAVRRVRAINAQGVTKMIRNILALQQNLRNIVIADTSTLTSGGQQSKQGLDATRNAIAEETMRYDNFEKSRRLWELLTKEPSVMLSMIRTTPAAKRATFDQYRSALTLMLGLDNSPAGAAATEVPTSATAPGSAGIGLPGAGLRRGTTNLAKDVSRQKFNELLIELHEVAGGDNSEEE